MGKPCICGKTEGVRLCSRCKTVGYCSKDCQAKDWKTHKNDCKVGPPKNSNFNETQMVSRVEDSNLIMWTALLTNENNFLQGEGKDTVVFQALVQNIQKESIKVNPDTTYLMFNNSRIKGVGAKFISVNGSEPSGDKQVILKQNEFTTVEISFVVGASEQPANENIKKLQAFVLPLRVDGTGVVKVEANLSSASLQKVL